MTALILLFTLSTQAAEIPISSGRSIEQRADSLYEMVSKEMIYISKKPAKFKAIQTTLKQLTQLSNQPENNETQVAYIEQYIEALQSLPSSKNFKSSRCHKYDVLEKAQPLLDGLCGHL